MGERSIPLPIASLVSQASPLPGGGVGLAGQPGGKEVTVTPQRAGVQISEVATENRRWLQALLFHPGQEHGCRVGFPFSETQNPRPAPGDVLKSELDGEGEHASPGAEGEQARAES
jgi:hypothetical protein